VGLLQALVRSPSAASKGSVSTLFDSVDGQIRDNDVLQDVPNAQAVAHLLRLIADLLERGRLP